MLMANDEREALRNGLKSRGKEMTASGETNHR